jgi:hypothetical protein
MTEQTINFAEPTLEQLAALRKAAGDEAAQVSFARESAGVRVTVRTTEQPPREWSTQIAPGLAPEQRTAVWEELISRVARSPGNTVTAASPSSSEPTAAEPTTPTGTTDGGGET